MKLLLAGLVLVLVGATQAWSPGQQPPDMKEGNGRNSSKVFQPQDNNVPNQGGPGGRGPPRPVRDVKEANAHASHQNQHGGKPNHNNPNGPPKKI